MCHHREESPSHYFLDCFLYLIERQTLFDQIEHYIPRFKNLTKQKKLDIILNGIDIENDDLMCFPFVHNFSNIYEPKEIVIIINIRQTINLQRDGLVVNF